MVQEIALSYPPLLVEGRFTPQIRDHQIDEAEKNRLPFFTVTIVPDKLGTDQKMMHLEGEMGTDLFREPEKIKDFLIEKGFIPESILMSKDGKLYATHPKQHLPYMHWIVRLLVHFQRVGEWLAVKYWHNDYLDK